MNDFKKDLAFSHAAEDQKMWGIVYQKAFPGCSISNCRDDGELQRHGIDRTIVLSSGKAVYVDEKVRRKAYNDILLEFISNDRYNTPGWVKKPLFADYIAYAILPKKVCYLLPVPQLQLAWLKNKTNWLTVYKKRTAPNTNYNTINCPVPMPELFKAIGQTLRINF